MLFGILGPLLVHDGDRAVEVPAARQRVLLATLLTQAGQVVPADALAETMWDGAPPGGVAITLRTYVMRLRRVLGPAAAARVITRSPGYLIDAAEDEVDLLRFCALCRLGGAAVRAGDWAGASRELDRALELWRGAPLVDAPSQVLRQAEVPRLEQLRMQALEWRADAGLALGHHRELVPELRALAAEHPLREHFQAQLMLALYRSGRQAEALEAYRQARTVLVTELGVEPGPELADLHGRILAGDPDLAARQPGGQATASGPAGPEATREVPRQLPAGVGHFTGRATEIQALTALCDEAGKAAAVVVAVIAGTAGVGKTALAVRWAHQMADRFPDGQLYVNLRGYDFDRPVTAADALAGFLRALGLAGPDIPAEPDERAARFRSLLADRRMLVVLDNASDVEQVRPLLPGVPGSAVVVTSRDSLAGLVARDGARRIDLDLLRPRDAVSLLGKLIGQRVDAEPGAAEALAVRCSRLPLALRVAAELAVARPSSSLGDLAAELADQQRRLDLLDAGGDPRTAVRAVFSWSYQHLDPDPARAFRLLGLHPGPDFDSYAVTALTGAPDGAGRLLSLLARANLIQTAGRDRFGLHDLLRAYAHELAAGQDPGPERRAALTRLFDYYLEAASAAMDALIPAERHRRPRIPASGLPIPPVTDSTTARTWLEAELANLVAVAAHTAAGGWPGHATRLGATLFRYLVVSGHYIEGRAIETHALRAAVQAGDRAAQAGALRSLGAFDARQGRYDQAASQLQQALATFREIGDLEGEARTLSYLGSVAWWQGRYPEAAGHLRNALAIFRETGDRFGQAATLNNVGIALEKQGQYPQAEAAHREALAIAREIGHSDDEAKALDNLGFVERVQGHYQEAAGFHRQALAVFREMGAPVREAHALDNLAVAERMQGQAHEAVGHHREAVALFHGVGDRLGEA